eukprot:980701-Amphidinium_carterae.1
MLHDGWCTLGFRSPTAQFEQDFWLKTPTVTNPCPPELQDQLKGTGIQLVLTSTMKFELTNAV